MTTNATSVSSPQASGARPDVLGPWKVVDVHRERADVATLSVRPLAGLPPRFRPAQFSMIGVPGVGEAPVSISSPTTERDAHRFTIRAVGAVTTRLVAARPGDVVTVRGPLGRSWDLAAAAGRRAVFVAGGIGIAPLRAAIHELVDGEPPHPDVHVLLGDLEPASVVYADWLDTLRARGVHVAVTVERVPEGEPWPWATGLVTSMLAPAVEHSEVEAYLCGPDAMMTAAVGILTAAGVPEEHIQLTLERNMQCGTGTCGHCQLGPLLVCRDGPVLRADEVGRLLEVDQL